MKKITLNEEEVKELTGYIQELPYKYAHPLITYLNQKMSDVNEKPSDVNEDV